MKRHPDICDGKYVHEFDPNEVLHFGLDVQINCKAIPTPLTSSFGTHLGQVALVSRSRLLRVHSARSSGGSTPFTSVLENAY